MKRIGISKKVRLKLYIKYEGICCYCRKDMEFDSNMTAEHLLHVYQGGTNEKSNLRIACRSCNAARGSRSYMEHKKYIRIKYKKKIVKKKELTTEIQKIGSKGGKKTMEQYGSEHFSRIAKKGWKKRRELQAQNKK